MTKKKKIILISSFTIPLIFILSFIIFIYVYFTHYFMVYKYDSKIIPTTYYSQVDKVYNFKVNDKSFTAKNIKLTLTKTEDTNEEKTILDKADRTTRFKLNLSLFLNDNEVNIKEYKIIDIYGPRRIYSIIFDYKSDHFGISITIAENSNITLVLYDTPISLFASSN